MNALRSTAYFLLLTSLLAGFGFTQNKRSKELPASAYRLASVTVIGSDRYKSEDLMRATNMQIGQTVHDDDFKDAARALGDSGAFTDVAYTYEYSPEGTKLQWQVKDASDFVPARFENFVWFSDQSLTEAIRASVPLFNGEITTRGRMADQVSQALQVLLEQKSIPGSVQYIAEGPDNGAVKAIVYSDSGPNIEIRNVEFSGANSADLARLQNAAKDLLGAAYVRSAVEKEAEKMFVPVYRSRGYLKALFSEPQAKVVSTDGNDITVDVIFTVNPGQQYKLESVDLAGTKVLPAETLRSLIHAKLSQPVDLVELDSDISTIKSLYGSRGYVAASIQPEPEINDKTSTARYVLHIDEGPAYKMGELEILGLDDHTLSRIQNDWTLRAGDTYDSSYVQRFLDQAYKEIGDWRVRVDETKNQDQTVDVTLRFDSRR